LRLNPGAIAVVLLAQLVLVSAACAAFPVEMKDDRGVAVRLSSAPRRLVSLAPSLTEIVFLLGQEKKLVGVTRYCNYPARAGALPKIGGIADPDIERIVAAAPDLVLCTTDGNPKEKVRAIEEMGIPCFAVSPQDLSGVYAAVERIGALLGVAGKARREAGVLRARADRAARKSGGPVPSVLFAVSTSPIIAAGKGTFMDELLLLAGGKNAASPFSGRYPRLTVEDLLAGKPDIIFIAAMAGVESFSPDVTRWREIPAFRDGEVVSLDGDIVTRPGPRMVAALEEVSRVLAAWRERRRAAAAEMERGKR
jgi:iron complex transport system substrate-binding protein